MEIVSKDVRSGWFRMRFAAIAIGFFAVLVSFPAHSAQAASLFLAPGTATVKVGQTVSISVYVESRSQAMNATQGVVSFPTDTVQVTSVGKAGSILNLWVKDPAFSNSAGTVNFEGIVYNPGFQGASGRILTISFRAKKAGQALIKFNSGAVLANDGQGTNVTSGLGSARITITEAEEVPVVSTPSAPAISSPTHPDPNVWYPNRNPEFKWALPADVTNVSILVDHDATTDPGSVSEGTASSHRLKDVQDGIWYLHVKFRNAQGWGAPAHFRFQIDTLKPESFELTEVTRRDPTNTTVKFLFTAVDKPSGIDHYDISLDGGEVIKWVDDGTHIYTINDIGVGSHTLKATAYDRAGNTLERSVSIEVTAPTVGGRDYSRLLVILVMLLLLLLLLCFIIIFLLLVRRKRQGESLTEARLQAIFDRLHSKIEEYDGLLEKRKRKYLADQTRILENQDLFLRKLKRDVQAIEESAVRSRPRGRKRS